MIGGTAPPSLPRGRTPAQAPAPVPVLELSGPKLSIAFESLALAAEEAGGIERYVDALKLKRDFFAEVLGIGRVHAGDELADVGIDILAVHAAALARFARRAATRDLRFFHQM